jgi:hypothetical protein
MPPRLSDEEKKRRGTFRADQSAEVRDKKLAAKVITGVFLSKIPEPKLPLGERGSIRRDKYDELAQMLKDQGNLTSLTVDWAEIAAGAWGDMHDAMSKGKPIPKHIYEAYKSITNKILIAEKVPNIGSPGKQNKFEGHGWSHKAGSQVRLIKAS